MVTAKEFYVLCGLYVVLSFILDMLISLSAYISEVSFLDFLMMITSFLQYGQILCDVAFVILVCMLFFKKIPSFLQKFIKYHPNLTTYAMYIGWFSFILFFVDMLVLLGIYFLPVSAFAQELILILLIMGNIACWLAALFIATKKVCVSENSGI
ncbi:MAG: hypothetical protein IJ852_03980 [Alphaproteobacteria bacterium]|nr:hypothetical protein [Alphaproteobacteria bacterium]